MSRRLFDAVEVDVPCPNCGDESKHSVGWMRMHKSVYCPRCGRRSEIDLEESDQALERLTRHGTTCSTASTGSVSKSRAAFKRGCR